MSVRTWIVAASATVGVALSLALAAPAGAGPGGVYLKTGDTVCFATAPDTFFRGCVTITTHFAATWTKQYLDPQGPSAAGIGRHTASLSPGAWACGDSGMGPVRLTGAASAPATWFIFGTDTDYAFVGTVFSVVGSSVETVFTPGPELTVLEFCVLNSGSQPLSANFELLPA